MTTTELLAMFANPETMKSLSVADTLYAGLVTTILGMGITFSALIILQFVIAFMDKALNRKKDVAAATIPVSQPSPAPVAAVKAEAKDDGELIAAITTAIAMSLKTSTSSFVIKNIEKVESHTPQWQKTGIIDQMNSRF